LARQCRGIDNKGAYEHLMLRGERVDAVVNEDVLLLKMDVEGFEPAVLKSSKGLFDRFHVDNVVMEYSPGAYEANGKWQEYHEVPGMLT
jgi:Methyltransferase FkbM domain